MNNYWIWCSHSAALTATEKSGSSQCDRPVNCRWERGGQRAQLTVRIIEHALFHFFYEPICGQFISRGHMYCCLTLSNKYRESQMKSSSERAQWSVLLFGPCGNIPICCYLSHKDSMFFYLAASWLYIKIMTMPKFSKCCLSDWFELPQPLKNDVTLSKSASRWDPGVISDVNGCHPLDYLFLPSNSRWTISRWHQPLGIKWKVQNNAIGKKSYDSSF